jgi:hypothetical protein
MPAARRSRLAARRGAYPGEHAPIIDGRLFEAVQTKPTVTHQGRRLRRQSSKALLMGKLFDDRGNPMTPTYAVKNGVRYRYYVSSVLNQGRKEEASAPPHAENLSLYGTSCAVPVAQAPDMSRPFRETETHSISTGWLVEMMSRIARMNSS